LPDFGFWPISDIATSLIQVRLLALSRHDLLTMSSSQFDPRRTSVPSGLGVVWRSPHELLPSVRENWRGAGTWARRTIQGEKLANSGVARWL